MPITCINYLLKMTFYNNNNNNSNSSINQIPITTGECTDQHGSLAGRCFPDCLLVDLLNVLTCLQASSQCFTSLYRQRTQTIKPPLFCLQVLKFEAHTVHLSGVINFRSCPTQQDGTAETLACVYVHVPERVRVCVVGVERELACSLKPLSWACLTYEPD